MWNVQIYTIYAIYAIIMIKIYKSRDSWYYLNGVQYIGQLNLNKTRYMAAWRDFANLKHMIRHGLHKYNKHINVKIK
jgi:hypothetical protein